MKNNTKQQMNEYRPKTYNDRINWKMNTQFRSVSASYDVKNDISVVRHCFRSLASFSSRKFSYESSITS